uniref:Uncharacterized protein n=1 Tax=Anopheles culicifacies TaxID=139723 RepID=A0A9I3CJM5_9DIPT
VVRTDTSPMFHQQPMATVVSHGQTRRRPLPVISGMAATLGFRRGELLTTVARILRYRSITCAFGRYSVSEKLFKRNSLYLS